MSFKQRYHEEFLEQFRKSFTPRDIILGDYRNLARHVDSDVIRKCKVRANIRKTKQIERTINSLGEDDEMDELRDTKSWSDLDCRDFNLGDNVAQIYFDEYSEGFYGEPYPSNDDKWICPHCGTMYKMILMNLPHYCTCGYRTPIGQLSEDGVLRR